MVPKSASVSISASIRPAAIHGRAIGSATRKKPWVRESPSDCAASSAIAPWVANAFFAIRYT